MTKISEKFFYCIFILKYAPQILDMIIHIYTQSFFLDNNSYLYLN
jgi:hypothetical protein